MVVEIYLFAETGTPQGTQWWWGRVRLHSDGWLIFRDTSTRQPKVITSWVVKVSESVFPKEKHTEKINFSFKTIASGVCGEVGEASSHTKL